MNAKKTTLALFCAFSLLGSSIAVAQSVDEVESLNNQVLALLLQGRFKQALPMGIKALKLSEDTLGPEHATTATSLNNLAGIYENLNDYATAQRLFERGLKIREKVLGPEHPFTARNLNNLANIYTKTGSYAKAEPLLQRALAINEKVLGPENSATVGNLGSLALLYWSMGKYAQAEPLMLRELELREKTQGAEHPNTARALQGLGGLYFATGDYAKSEAFYQRALKMLEKNPGPERPETAITLGSLGLLYLKLGDYAKAEPRLQSAVKIQEKALGPEHPDTAKGLGKLAGLYRTLGDYAKAEALEQQVLKIQEKILGAEHPDTAVTLNNLAALYRDMGNYTNAEALQLRALRIQEKILGPEHPQTTVSLGNLATTYESLGDYAKAEAFFERALKIQEKNPGPEHQETALTLGALGRHYVNLGDYGKAEPVLQRSLKILQQALGPEHPDTAMALNGLAGLYQKMGDYSKAARLAQIVLASQEKALGPEHPQTALVLNDLAVIYERMGDCTSAEPLLRRAIKIQEKALGTEHPVTAVSIINLAAAYAGLGDYGKAEPFSQRALTIHQKVFGQDHPATVQVLQNLGFLYFDMQNRAKATELAEKVEQGNLSTLANVLSFTSEQERLAYQARSNPYSLFASLGAAPQLTQAILRNKGVVLDSLIEDHLLAEASSNPETRALVEQLGPAKQRLTQLLMEPPKDLSEQGLKRRAAERQKLTGEVERLEGALGRNVAGLGHARRALTVTCAEVQGALPGSTVLVELLRYHHYLGKQKWEERYGAAIVTGAGEPKWVCLESVASIDANILIYQQSVRHRTDEAGLAAVLQDLYRQVWAPIETLLPDDTQTVIISPDARLNFVSFATLLTPDNQFLARKHSLRYVTSGRDLLTKAESATGSELVVFASPEYSDGRTGTLSRSGLYLAPLTNFAANAAALEAQAKKWNWPVSVYLGANATETRLREVRSPHILHLATHGFLLPETIRGVSRSSFLGFITDPGGTSARVLLRNPMQRSGVALAGAQVTVDAWQRGEIPPTGNDGILTAEEVSGLSLRGTWLVVLSACDTGIGELRLGEGVMGLRRGFVQAGAQNLLLTLWPVFDISSGKFLLDFYAAVQKTGNAPEALASVQRDWLIKVREQDGLSAAVVLGGPFIMSSQGQFQGP